MTRRKALVQREPNGRAKREPDGPSPTAQARLRDAAANRMADPVWGTAIGWLAQAKRITATQFAAGQRWTETVVKYHIAVQIPREPRSVALDPKGGTPADPNSYQGLKEARRDSQAIHRYLGALDALRRAGDLPQHVVRHLCEYGQSPAGTNEHKALAKGLDALAAYWSERRK
jgi:hypothetical protein